MPVVVCGACYVVEADESRGGDAELGCALGMNIWRQRVLVLTEG